MKKIISKLIISTFAFFILATSWSCSKESTPKEENIEEEIVKTLKTNTTSIAFDHTESNEDVTITTDVDSWVISSSGTSWIALSKSSGSAGVTVIKISASENSSITGRSTEITVNANKVTPVKISVTQAGIPSTNGLYPDYNTNPIPADATGMTKTAVEIAAEINLGWNIGNSLEATGSETAWGNPVVTKQLIDAVKANGFNAVRIPCSWNQYLTDDVHAEIKTTWLNRVKEVVQYCIDNDLYVLLNIHWDGEKRRKQCEAKGFLGTNSNTSS